CCAVSQGFAAPTTAGDPNGREWATSAFERRHSLLATVTYPVNAALEVTALGRLTSGVPFTPLVGSDVNGDGARNDRAFRFDAAPDPVLLYVRGFDPVARRFSYIVNGRFGATASANGGVTVPFQLAIQAHLLLGPMAPSRRVRALLGEPGAPDAGGGASGRGGVPPDFAARLAQMLPNPMPAILSYRDSLRRTAGQIVRLQAISDSLDAAIRVVSGSLQAE